MKYRVLLVGSEQCDGQFSEVLLSSREIACAWCRNTTQAADVFERDHSVIDMILVSVRAGGEMSSEEFVRWVRGERYRRPVLALTEDVPADNLRIATHIRAGCNMHFDRMGVTVARMEELLADAALAEPQYMLGFRVVRERVSWRQQLRLWCLDVFILQWIKGVTFVPQAAKKASKASNNAPDPAPEPVAVQ